MRKKSLVQGVNISPKKFLGILMLIHIFPLICFANAMTVGDFTTPEAFAIGYVIDIIFAVVIIICNFALNILD